MRTLFGAVIVWAVLVVALSCPAEPEKGVAFSSERPLYAKVALTEDGSRILSLAFDESAGTGKGYDRLYADVNFNGDLTDDKAIEGKRLGERGPSSTCSFNPFSVDVPYNEKSKGVKKPWELTVAVHEYTRTRLFGLVRGQTQRHVSVNGKMTLKDEAGEWEYMLASGTQPAETLAEATPVRFGGKPVLRVMTQPDREKEGNTGIAAYLRLDPVYLAECLKAGQPVKAHVLVKDKEGKTVHSEDVNRDKLTFG